MLVEAKVLQIEENIDQKLAQKFGKKIEENLDKMI